MAKERARRAYPIWVKGDKTTKSGGGKVIKGGSPKRMTKGGGTKLSENLDKKRKQDIVLKGTYKKKK